MGAPSKALVEAWSDGIAARLKLDLTGYDNELVAAANATLWAQIDASTDPAVVNALGAPSLAIDEANFPENYWALFGTLTGRTPYREAVTALNSLVVGAGGGGYASLQAYLNSLGSQVHPLFAELARATFSQKVLDNALDVTEVFPPNYQSRAPLEVYTGADGALVDDSADAASAAVGDVAFFGTNGHHVYVRSRHKFGMLVAALSTVASVTTGTTVEYWNGSAWAAAAGLADGSAGFTKNDRISWTIPTGWVKTAKDGSGAYFPSSKIPLYTIRLTRVAVTVATPPVASCLRIIPVIVPTAQNGVSHLGVDQPPLAICRITAANTLVVELPSGLVGIDYARFAEAPVRLRALTPIAANLTPTISYVNQAGADETQIQSAWSSPAALDTVAVTLNGADTGVRSAKTAGWVIATTANQGVFEVYVPEVRAPAL